MLWKQINTFFESLFLKILKLWFKGLELILMKIIFDILTVRHVFLHVLALQHVIILSVHT